MVKLFWLIALGVLFFASSVVFISVLRQPRNTTEHLNALTGSLLAFIVTGTTFAMMLAFTLLR